MREFEEKVSILVQVKNIVNERRLQKIIIIFSVEILSDFDSNNKHDERGWQGKWKLTTQKYIKCQH
jgi:hypothetical protein